jgi:protein TonB
MPSDPGGGQYGERPVSASAATPAGTLEGLPPQPGNPGGVAEGGAASPAALPSAGAAGLAREGADIILLRRRIESRIVYPEEAIRRGQEGEVLLRIRVGDGGIPKEIRVARSSGARSLDDAARVGVVRAAPLPSTSGWFEVPVRFHLR